VDAQSLGDGLLGVLMSRPSRTKGCLTQIAVTVAVLCPIGGRLDAQRLHIWDAVIRSLRQDQIPRHTASFNPFGPPPAPAILHLPLVNLRVEADSGWASTLAPRDLAQGICVTPTLDTCAIGDSARMASIGAPVLLARGTAAVHVVIVEQVAQQSCAAGGVRRWESNSRWLMARIGATWVRVAIDSVTTRTENC